MNHLLLNAIIALLLSGGAPRLEGDQEKKEAAKEEVKDEKKEEKKDEKKEEKKEEKKDEKKEEKKDEKGDDKKEKEAAGAAKPAGEKPAAEKPAAEKPAAEKPAAEKAGAEKEIKKKKPPMIPIFRMRDGTRISGAPELDKVTIDTSYGRLVVPRADLVRLRFCQEKDGAIDDRIKAEIAKLGSEEFEAREAAMVQLREIGAPALKLLQEAVKSSDEEVKNRAQTLITEIEESIASEEAQGDEDGTPLTGTEDELTTVKFAIRGKIEERKFRVKSNYGDLVVDRKDIISIVFQEFTPPEIEIDVNANYLAPSNNWLETKISVEKGDRLDITASGQVNLQNYGWVVGPEGTPNVGNHFENFPGGALVARIGKAGKAFLVGPQFKDKANAGGKLMFAIAFRRGNIAGSFNVKVKMKPQEGQ